VTIGAGLFSLGLAAVIINFRKLWRNKYIRFMIILCVSYMVILWVFNYRTYLKLGAAQAIQARYTYPILIFMFIVLGKAMLELIQNKNIRLILLVIVAFGFVWGGGIIGWLLRADPNWYWPNDLVVSINQ